MLYRLCFSILASDRLASFADEALLLWPGCTPGENADPSSPGEKEFALEMGAAIGLDKFGKARLQKELRARGIDSPGKHPHRPEFFAFRFAGGSFGGETEGRWKFRHLYTGQQPFPGRKKSLNARKHGRHFTQTAGMACVHPVVVEALPHYASVVCALRARSFLQFGYDPDHYFCQRGHDHLGFIPLQPTRTHRRMLVEKDAPFRGVMVSGVPGNQRVAAVTALIDPLAEIVRKGQVDANT